MGRDDREYRECSCQELPNGMVFCNMHDAAPDLLAALSDLDHWLATEFPKGFLGSRDEARRIHLLRAARAAIAKATIQERGS